MSNIYCMHIITCFKIKKKTIEKSGFLIKSVIKNLLSKHFIFFFFYYFGHSSWSFTFNVQFPFFSSKFSPRSMHELSAKYQKQPTFIINTYIMYFSANEFTN